MRPLVGSIHMETLMDRILTTIYSIQPELIYSINNIDLFGSIFYRFKSLVILFRRFGFLLVLEHSHFKYIEITRIPLTLPFLHI